MGSWSFENVWIKFVPANNPNICCWKPNRTFCHRMNFTHRADRSALRTCIQVTLKQFISGGSWACQLFLMLYFPDLVCQHEFKCLILDAHIWKFYLTKTTKPRNSQTSGKTWLVLFQKMCKRVALGIWMKKQIFSLRNIFTMRNIVINMKYLSLCCEWILICSDNFFLVLMLPCSLSSSMDCILDELSSSVPILFVMAWMKLPQSRHGKEEVVKFPAELIMFSVVQLEQSCISHILSKVTLRNSASS